jgi:hypothetical protein
VLGEGHQSFQVSGIVAALSQLEPVDDLGGRPGRGGELAILLVGVIVLLVAGVLGTEPGSRHTGQGFLVHVPCPCVAEGHRMDLLFSTSNALDLLRRETAQEFGEIS